MYVCKLIDVFVKKDKKRKEKKKESAIWDQSVRGGVM